MQLCKYIVQVKSIAVFRRFLACTALYVSLCSYRQNGVSYLLNKNQPAEVAKVSYQILREPN